MDVTTMQGLQQCVILALALSTTVTYAQFAPPEPDFPREQTVAVAIHTDERIDIISPTGFSARLQEIHVPGAKFIKLHFSQFSPPEGAVIEISNREGSEIYRYSATHRDSFTFDIDQGDNGETSFWAMSISGDTAIVRIRGDLTEFDPSIHNVEIDSQLTGLVRPDPFTKDLGEPTPGLETECGAEERYDAVCWADTHPDEYERSTPVALLITANGKECTAWRVGSGNRMFTAQHCIASQSELDGTEIWFNYEATSCSGSATSPVIKVSGGELLESNVTLDYALFTVSDFSSITGFGNFGLDVRNGLNGEEIFIPQHGLGNPKQMAIESDMNDNGLCQIDDNDLNGFTAGSDIGYLCDTTTSSSGAPVVASATGKVIALHHWGGCFNSGTKVSLIWPQVADHFNGVVPKGDSTGNWAPGNEAPLADFSALCDGLGCSFDANDSFDADGNIVSFTWDFGEGASADGATAEYLFAVAGTYDVMLTVEDDEGATDSLVHAVTVAQPNADPVARFSTTCIDNSCTFDAGSSSDEDGSIVNWNWSLGDGNSASGQSVEHLYAEAGSYSITLTVEDDDAATDSTGYTVILTMPNESPTAGFNVTCSALDCALDGGSSQDPDGEISSYAWDFGDGGSASGPTADHNYSATGSYTITLTVRDNRGASAIVNKIVSVEAANLEPEASFTFSCDKLECNFDASTSTDEDGTIRAYSWSFGDGGSGSGQNISHTYTAGGSFIVTLEVDDDQGAVSSRTRSVTISTTPKFELSGSGSLKNGRALATLMWSGPDSSTVQVLRDGELLAEAANVGKYLDANLQGFRKSARYQLCEPSLDLCSNEIMVRFNP